MVESQEVEGPEQKKLKFNKVKGVGNNKRKYNMREITEMGK